MPSKSKQDIYKAIFNNSPVAIIELDYSSIVKLKEQLRRHTVTNVRHYLLEHPVLIKKIFQKVKIIESNVAAHKLFATKSPKGLLTKITKIFTTSAIDVLIEQFASLLSGELVFEGEFKYKAAPYPSRDLFLSSSISGSHKKKFSHVILALQDITTWKKLERELRKRAKLDGLTKLLNHGAVVERLEEEIMRAKRYGLSLSCLMVDLDFFKVINDKFGHPKGDSILKKVSKMINYCFRKTDIVGRYGGDEFLVILPETKVRLSKYAAQRLQKSFAGTMFRYKNVISFHITLSIGIAGYPSKRVKDAKDLIALADKAMYACKMTGRNKIEISKE